MKRKPDPNRPETFATFADYEEYQRHQKRREETKRLADELAKINRARRSHDQLNATVGGLESMIAEDRRRVHPDGREYVVVATYHNGQRISGVGPERLER